MKRILLYLLLLFGSIFMTFNFISAQIVKHPDPNLVIDRSKAILVVTPCSSGSIFLNDYYLTEIDGNDTVYFNNLAPGTYNFRFQTQTMTIKEVISLQRGSSVAIRPCSDSVELIPSDMDRIVAISETKGVKYVTLKKGYFYNITQLALFQVEIKTAKGDFFNEFTTINGYQIVPGFCTGIGLSYNHYRTEIIEDFSWSDYEEVTIHFLPIFLDLRSHLPSSQNGRVSPFFKFDIGYNLLLNNPEMRDNYSNNLVSLKKGGIYVSPGFGLRICVNDLVQIVTSFEFSVEKLNYELSEYITWYDPPYYNLTNDHYNFVFFKICLGVAFQYK